jgi:CDGSH-type Zn-finger protein
MTQVPATDVVDRSHIAPVTTREELIYLLSRASELEHGLACVYLFAAYSLKGDPSEGGVTTEQAQTARHWKRRLAEVAVEEMLHLGQVSNLLTAIGGAPHFKRANFPMPASAFPLGIELTLEPFSTRVIERLLCFEMPEAGILSAQKQAVFDQIRARITARPADEGATRVQAGPVETEPFEVDFRTVGEFYHKIRTGFENIPEDVLFIGPPEAQANARYLDLNGELIAVVDRASACAAIEMIVQQGEAPSSDHPDSHFAVFDAIRREYAAALASGQTNGTVFDPVRPVISNPMTRFYDDSAGGHVISDPLTHEAADLFNSVYDTMLLMLLRFFAHTGESEEEFRMLARGTLRMMASVLRPLGEALTKMPAGEGFPGKTAGPGFGYNRDIHLLAHKESAWIFFLERLQDLVSRTVALGAQPGVPAELQEAAAALQSVGDHLIAYIPARSAGRLNFHQSIEATPTVVPERNGPYLVHDLTRMTNSKGENLGTRPALALCRCGHSAIKPYCDGTHARIGFVSDKLPGRVADHRDNYQRDGLTIHDNRGICQHAGFCTDGLPAVFRAGKEPFVDPNGAATQDAIVDQIKQCPSGALSFSIDGVEPSDQERPPTITVSKNGPYRITGGIELKEQQWGEGSSREHYALCRCGGSKNKPFCDGTHWYNNFTDDDN